jgi:thioredoxin 1
MANIVNEKMEVIGNFEKRSDFKEYVKNNKFVIVKFSATWCGPCQRIKDIFKTYYNSALSYEKDIKLVLVDIDEDREVSNLLRVRSVPTMVSYINNTLEYTCTSSKQEDVKHFFEDTVLKIKSYNNSKSYYTDVV